MIFEERTPIEAGFAEVFDRDIRLTLAQLDAEEGTYKRKRLLHSGLAFVACVSLGLFIALLVGGREGVISLILCTLVGGGGAWAVYGSGTDKYQRTVANRIVPVVTDFLGDMTYTRSPGQLALAETVHYFGLVEEHEKAIFQDHLSGQWQGTPFEVVEVSLTDSYEDANGNHRVQTVFRGLIYRFDLGVMAPTRLLIGGDTGVLSKGLLGKLRGSAEAGMSRVTDVACRLPIHADNAARARAWLRPETVEALETAIFLSTRHGGREPRAAFVGTQLYIAVPRTREYFELTDLERGTQAIPEGLHRVFEEIATLREMIDVLDRIQPVDAVADEQRA